MEEYKIIKSEEKNKEKLRYRMNLILDLCEKYNIDPTYIDSDGNMVFFGSPESFEGFDLFINELNTIVKKIKNASY